MAIRATCACGAVQDCPDAWAGREVSCPTCGRQFHVTGAPPAGPQTAPARAAGRPPVSQKLPPAGILALVVLILGWLGGTVYVSYLEARKEVRARGYTPKPAQAVDPAIDEERIREALRAFGASGREPGTDGVARRLHTRRMIVEMNAVDPSYRIQTHGEETAAINDLLNGIATLLRGNGVVAWAWNTVVPTGVHFSSGKPEATATARVRLGEMWGRFRFWLIKEDDQWMVYDLESVADGVRMSAASATILKSEHDRPLKDLLQRTNQTKMSLVGLVVGKDDERILEGARQARKAGIPPIFAPQFDFMEGMALFRLGRPKEALPLFERALGVRKDMVSAEHGRALALLELGRNEEAVRAEAESIEVGGPDAEGLDTLGRALEGSGKSAEAIAAFRKGTAFEDDWECRVHLARLLVAAKKLDEVLLLLVEACRRAPAEEWQVEAARVVIELLRQSPLHVNMLEGHKEFETVLKRPEVQEVIRKAKDKK